MIALQVCPFCGFMTSTGRSRWCALRLAPACSESPIILLLALVILLASVAPARGATSAPVEGPPRTSGGCGGALTIPEPEPFAVVLPTATGVVVGMLQSRDQLASIARVVTHVLYGTPVQGPLGERDALIPPLLHYCRAFLAAYRN